MATQVFQNHEISGEIYVDFQIGGDYGKSEK
jgi:hypothetical protein